eukprot:4519029-Pyramimonas_sp.AAC.1
MPAGLELEEEDRRKIEERASRFRAALATKAKDLFAAAMEEAKRGVDEHESQKLRLIAKERRVGAEGDEAARVQPGAAEAAETPTESAASASSGGSPADVPAAKEPPPPLTQQQQFDSVSERLA